MRFAMSWPVTAVALLSPRAVNLRSAFPFAGRMWWARESTGGEAQG